MKVLIAPQELKGTLTAAQAAEAISRGVQAGLQGAQVELLPVADGGPGTVDAYARATGAEVVEWAAEDALCRATPAAFAVKGERAVIEMSSASGLCKVFPADRNPLQATTRGTGQLIEAAVQRGCKELWIGLGGSATTDGGTGALDWLGARFYDAEGNRLPQGGGALVNLARVKLERAEAKLRGVRLIALTDVRAPLLGPEGCARVFAPQKGATPEEVELLERGLARLHQVALEQHGKDFASEPGTGAAGGLGYGLRLLGAELREGFGALAELSGLEERIRRADLVVTAEGRLDAQTAMGKGPLALARICQSLHKPCVILAGSIAPGAPVERFCLAEPIGGGERKSALPSTSVATTLLEAAAWRIAPRFPELQPRGQD